MGWSLQICQGANSGSGFPANNLEADGRGAHEDAQMKFAIHRSEPEWEEEYLRRMQRLLL